MAMEARSGGRPAESEACEAVLVFLRLPVAGKVKTRLARTIGDEAAKSFYQRCAEQVLLEAFACGAEVLVFCSEAAELEQVREWVEPLGSCQVLPQVATPDLGERMCAAFDAAFEQLHNRRGTNSSVRAVVVGTDVPDLSAGVIRRAFSSLAYHDAVIGPALDGGYYLLGQTRPNRCLFEGIAWSTDTVYRDTVAKAYEPASNVRLAPSTTLPTLGDIDTEQVRAGVSHARTYGGANEVVARQRANHPMTRAIVASVAARTCASG